MKTPFIASIIVLGLSLFSNAQEHRRSQSPDSGNHHQGHGPEQRPNQNVDPRGRQQHLREALRHLKAAGLGHVAERIENSLQSRSHQDGGHRAGPPAWQPSPRGLHHEAGRPHASDKPHQSNNDDLRPQMQRLSRQVEELGNIVRKLAAESHRPPHAGKHSNEESKEKCEANGKCNEGKCKKKGDEKEECKKDRDDDEDEDKDKDRKKDKGKDKGKDRDKRSESDSDSETKPAILPAPVLIS